MGLLIKPLNTMLAVLVALPLGPGGLCCCVIGGACGHADADSSVPAEMSHSCCSVEFAEAVPESSERFGGALPATCAGVDTARRNDAAGCDCPTRDEGLVPSVPNEDRLAFTSFMNIADPAEAWTIASVSEPADHPHPSEVHRPPPKVPLHTTLAVFLC